MSRPKIHLDTDIGGDIDDLCALAMLLRWPGVELAGVTTVSDDRGRRAGYARYVLGMEGRPDVPLTAGADVSGGFYRYALDYLNEERYWPEPVSPSPNPPEEALDLLRKSIEAGATIVAIGPYTNLALLEEQNPGILESARLFLMGGYIFPPRPGLPQWGNEMDYNIQVDVKSAARVLRSSHPTLIPLSVTLETSMRRAFLDDLRASGALGRLIAQQAEAFAIDSKHDVLFGETCPELPEDTINFQHDPLACAIALGWNDGVEIQELPLLIEEKDGYISERVDPYGKQYRVVTRVDGPRFSRFWLERVTG
jgi:purine nucleosidase